MIDFERMQRDIVGTLSGGSFLYYRKSDPLTGIPFTGVYQGKQENKELGGFDSGMWIDSPHIFIRLGDLDFTPIEGDEVEARGEKIKIYKVMFDAEGGATLHLGDYRY